MNKYGNRKVEFNGYKFDSAKEMKRYCELKILERMGHIKDLKVKSMHEIVPANPMFRKVEYEDDFSYVENGETIVEDVKPDFKNYKAEKNYKKTAAYQMFLVKKKLMYHVHGILVKEV